MTTTTYFAVDPLTASAVAELQGVWDRAQEQLPDASLYALIDTAFDETACASYLAERAEGASLSLYEGLMLEDLGSISPWLVRLNTSSAKMITEELQVLRLLRGNRPMLSFVASALDLPALQQHFKPFVEVVVDGDLPLLLRFADTRITDPLFEAFTAAQKAAFVPPDMGLWFPRRKSGSVGGVLPKASRPDAIAFKQLRLDKQQYGQLIDAGDIDLIIKALTTTNTQRFAEVRASDVHAFMAKQIGRARARGLSDRPNLEIYCATAWATGPEFDLQPEFTYAIQRASYAPGQLGAFVNEIPDSAWTAAARITSPKDGT